MIRISLVKTDRMFVIHTLASCRLKYISIMLFVEKAQGLQEDDSRYDYYPNVTFALPFGYFAARCYAVQNIINLLCHHYIVLIC